MAGRAGDTLQPVSSRPATEATRIATRSQARARRVLSLATALSRSVTPHEVADAMLDEGLRALGADAGWFVLVAQSEDGAIAFPTIRSSRDDEVEIRHDLITPHPGRPLSDAILSRRPVLIDSRADWDARYPGQYSSVASTDHEALAALPVVGDRVLAAMVFAFRGPRTFDDDTRTDLETISQLCAQALDRSRTQSVLSAIGDAVVAVDPEFRYTYVNESAAKLLAKPVESLVGRQVWDTFVGAEDAEFRRLFRAAMIGRSAIGYETYSSPLRRWLSIRAVPSGDAGLVVFLEDATRGRRARDASDFLIEASEVLSSSLDYETMLQNLASAAVPRIADWCAVDMLQSPGDRSGPPTLRRVALTNDNPETVDKVNAPRETLSVMSSVVASTSDTETWLPFADENS